MTRIKADMDSPAMDYRNMSDEDLFLLPLTEEDRLPRDAADEIIRRGDVSVGAMRAIIDEESLWKGRLPEWWATVHVAAVRNSRSVVLKSCTDRLEKRGRSPSRPPSKVRAGFTGSPRRRSVATIFMAQPAPRDDRGESLAME
ncbi:MAG: hypothetical protein V2A66_06430 [Pseudomonadota bacterium]